MDMNQIIVVCAALWTAASVSCMFGRSRMIQRVGCMELILTAAVGGCALFGFLKAADFTEKQYHQMLAISLEQAAPYLTDLEDELEVYGGSDEAFIREAERVVEDALPILRFGEGQDIVNGLFLVKRDEQGAYKERFRAGEAVGGWEDVQAAAVPLIGRARRSRETVWLAYESKMAVFVITDRSRIAPAYALVVLVSEQPLAEALTALKTQYFYYSLLFMTAATLLVILAVLLQEKEMHRILRLLVRAVKGREETTAVLKRAGTTLFRGESNEAYALHNSLKQIAINTERRNYLKYQALRAYYRFVPREIEKILGKQSILDVKPMDQAKIMSTAAFVSFAEREDLSEEEYLRQLKGNYALLCEGCRAFGGSMLADGCHAGAMLLLFYEESRKALQFGIQMTVRELVDQSAGQAFVLLHRTSLVYGVAGNEEQSFPYVYSDEVRILQKYTDSLRAMGVRMAVTDRVLERDRDYVESRYIGYIEEGRCQFPLYEILDAHPTRERQRRMAGRRKFQQALDLYYQSDFYLARNLFSEVLRSCPGDEVAKWYLFLCESGLNREKEKRQSFGLFSGK